MIYDHEMDIIRPIAKAMNEHGQNGWFYISRRQPPMLDTKRQHWIKGEATTKKHLVRRGIFYETTRGLVTLSTHGMMEVYKLGLFEPQTVAALREYSPRFDDLLAIENEDAS